MVGSKGISGVVLGGRWCGLGVVTLLCNAKVGAC